MKNDEKIKFAIFRIGAENIILKVAMWGEKKIEPIRKQERQENNNNKGNIKK